MQHLCSLYAFCGRLFLNRKRNRGHKAQNENQPSKKIFSSFFYVSMWQKRLNHIDTQLSQLKIGLYITQYLCSLYAFCGRLFLNHKREKGHKAQNENQPSKKIFSRFFYVSMWQKRLNHIDTQLSQFKKGLYITQFLCSLYAFCGRLFLNHKRDKGHKAQNENQLSKEIFSSFFSMCLCGKKD